MDITELSIKRPLVIIMVILAMVLFGAVMFSRFAVDIMPEMDLPYVTVQSVYPGAGPEEIENNVAEPIEEEMVTISGLKNLSSYCMESVCFTILEFEGDVDADLASIDVKDKIDGILNDLPDDLEKPVISKFNPNEEPIVYLALTGDAPLREVREVAENDVKDALSKLQGVAKVDITGGRQREVVIDLEKEKLDAHGLSVIQVLPILKAASSSLPAGHIKGVDQEYTVKLAGKFKSIQEIRDLRLPVTKQGRAPVSYTVKLSEIAEVKDGFKEVRKKGRFRGKEAVLIEVTKRPDANTVGVAQSIIAGVDDIQESLSAGYELSVSQDDSDFIRNAVNDTYLNLILGIVLTSLILLLFLHDWKLMIIVAVTMPVSIVIALIPMKMMGFTLNIVTLMALTIAIGVLVTNSIVVLENIVRHTKKGDRPYDAAISGTKEIMLAVFASTLTNLAVFIPIATTQGITSFVFKSLGLTIVFATVVSLFLSFTLTPLMASRLIKSRDNNGESHALDRFLTRVDLKYGKVLSNILSSRGSKAIIVVSVVLIFIGTMVFLAPRLGSEFMSESDEGVISVTLEMPPGTKLSVTEENVKRVEELVMENFNCIESISSKVGEAGMLSSGPNFSSMTVKLSEKSERDKSTDQVISEMRPLVADIPDGDIVIQSTSSMAGGPSQADIELEVYGDNLDDVLVTADSLVNRIKGIAGLTDVRSSWQGTKPEIRITPDRDRMEHYGLSSEFSMRVQELGGLLRYSISGNDAAEYTEDNEDYPVRFQLDAEDRNSIEDIRNFSVITPKGSVPLQAIAEVSEAEGVSSVNRENRQKMVTVYANVSEGAAGTKVEEIEEEISDFDFMSDISYGFGGDQEMMGESFLQLFIAAALAVVLTYMVLVGLLESFSMAFVIWLTLPLGLVGVIWALLLTGNTLSMLSMMSIIMLIGIVVNNAILLIDYARQECKAKGVSASDAIVSSAEAKFRPILMMNLAIVAAMLPQALGLGSGGEFRAPFAITAIGGIMVSTTLTLFITPILYVFTAPKKPRA